MLAHNFKGRELMDEQALKIDPLHKVWDPDTRIGDMLKGKRGLIVGVANADSIAYGCAVKLRAFGAELALTYLNEKSKRFVEPLAAHIEASLLLPLDVEQPGEMEAVFKRIEAEWGQLDFVVHSIAFANKDELKGSFVENTTREGFLRALNISAFSFVDCARRAAELMPDGGSIITLTYMGSERAIPNYNTMGVAKAALESATRYAARDLGPKGIRVNAVSPGAMRTLSLAGIQGGRGMLAKGRSLSAMKEDTAMEGVAGCALWLLSDLGLSTTGEVIHVDAGFHIMGFSDDEAE
jgi:enoyl-[acyl-carrier protein] reductase I